MNIQINSKLPNTGTTIFSVMSALANEHNAINLSQGFPNYDSGDQLFDLVTRYMKEGKNQYAPMPGHLGLREQIANKYHSLYGEQYDPGSEIVVTAGATQAIFTTITAFIRSGNEAIIIEPAYDCYRPAIELNDGLAVPYELEAPHYKIDWDRFKRLINIRTKMIIVNTPQNPSTNVFTTEDWDQLAKLVQGTDIIILSDEVYEHIIFDGVPHASILKHPELKHRSIATYSFGKTFHNTGWKLGYCMGPKALMKEFTKVHQFNVFSVNTPMQYALADFIEDPTTYKNLSAFYQAKRDRFAKALEPSRFKMIPSAGTYFQLADYSEISNLEDTEFAKQLTMEHGVAAIPVSVFYSSGRQDQVIRFCFAKTDDLLDQAAERLVKI